MPERRQWEALSVIFRTDNYNLPQRPKTKQAKQNKTK